MRLSHLSKLSDLSVIVHAFEEDDEEKFEQFIKSYHKLFSAAESNLSNILYQLQNK